MMIGSLLCTNCETRPIENQDTGYCASCGAMFRKEERQALKDASKVKKPIAKRSPKRAAEERQYLILCREYLIAYPVCEVVECHQRSNQVHHVGGRANDNLLDVNLFLAVCPDCHEKITRDSKWSIDNGYSIIRST